MQKFLVSLGLHLLKKHYTEGTAIFFYINMKVTVVTITPLKFEFNKLNSTLSQQLNTTTKNDEKYT